jgi:cytochrome P450
MTKLPPGQHFLEWSVQTPNDGLLLLRSPFHKSRILVTKPKALADLLVKNPYDFVKPRTVRDFLRKVLGDGLIIVEGGVHRFQRKNTMPAFSFRHIKDLYPMMWRKAVLLTQTVAMEIEEQSAPTPALGKNEKPIQKTTEITTWAGKVTLDIIGVAGLGAEFNAMKSQDHQLVKNYDELLEPTTEKLLFFLTCISLTTKFVRKLPWAMNEVFYRTTSSLREITSKLVQEKREAIKTGSDDHFDILSLLIQSNNFSNDELVDQLLTFLAAGLALICSK